MKTKTLTLQLNDVFDEEFRLLAIYCDEEDYRMAFLLNYFKEMEFQRTASIILPKISASFSVFEFIDSTNYRTWNLIYNYCLKDEKVTKKKSTQSFGLFSEVETRNEKPVFLIKEFSKARFLLKIEAEESEAFYDSFLNSLKDIPQIYTCEWIDLNRIKNMNLLHF